MSSICQEFQDRWLETTGLSPVSREPVSRDSGAPSVAGDVWTEHLRTCQDCARFARSAGRLSRALCKLSRQAVPAELSGRVVAACQAGYRQDRAVTLLRSIVRHEAPVELDRKVLALDPSRAGTDWRGTIEAPPVLGRLVAEDLADPTKAIARRFAGRLERLNAPRELVSRLEAGALRPASPRLRISRASILWVAAGLFAAIGGGVFLTQRGSEQPATRYTFVVQHVDSLASMEPFVQSLAVGLSGGTADAEKYRRD